ASETKFGIDGGAGFNFGSSATSFFVEGRFHNVFVPGSDFHFIPLTAGIRFGGRGGGARAPRVSRWGARGGVPSPARRRWGGRLKAAGGPLRFRASVRAGRVRARVAA